MKNEKLQLMQDAYMIAWNEFVGNFRLLDAGNTDRAEKLSVAANNLADAMEESKIETLTNLQNISVSDLRKQARGLGYR